MWQIKNILVHILCRVIWSTARGSRPIRLAGVDRNWCSSSRAERRQGHAVTVTGTWQWRRWSATFFSRGSCEAPCNSCLGRRKEWSGGWIDQSHILGCDNEITQISACRSLDSPHVRPSTLHTRMMSRWRFLDRTAKCKVSTGPDSSWLAKIAAIDHGLWLIRWWLSMFFLFLHYMMMRSLS